MKTIFIFLFGIYISIMFTSCDKVGVPYRNIPDIDSTYYPGVWGDYVINEWPTFEQNTNTQRNILIDKFTGHKCPNCTKAADTAYSISQDFPNRVFFTSLHASPGGTSFYQSYNPTDVQFFTNHTKSNWDSLRCVFHDRIWI